MNNTRVIKTRQHRLPTRLIAHQPASAHATEWIKVNRGKMISWKSKTK